MKFSRQLSIVLLILLAVLTVNLQSRNVQAQYSSTGTVLSTSRITNLTIKIVFMGIDPSQVNATYLLSPINLPEAKYQAVTEAGVDTGVLYNFTYATSFADTNTLQSFTTYLGGSSVQTTQARTSPPSNQWNPYFSNSTSDISTVQTTYYNASGVENWFSSNFNSFGSAPASGYTIFIADLHNYLPSFSYTQYQQDKCVGPYAPPTPCTPQYTATLHYYNRSLTDGDLGLYQTRHYMTAWGGNARFYYIDLSAGPSYLTGDQPVQVAAGLDNVPLSSPQSVAWYTQLVSDYVAGAVFNLFAPDQIYPVTYSSHYNFHLFIIDNRTQAERLAGPTLQESLNTTYVQEQLSSLLPFATVTVTPNFSNVDDYPGLAQVVAASSSGIVDPNLNHHVVNLRPVYDWLSLYSGKNLHSFIPTIHNDPNEIDIPALIFAFKGDYNFGFTVKGDIASVDGPQSLYGIALPDMVLISHGQYDLTAGQSSTPLQGGKGVGFTQTVVHELGHEMGLEHPFNYDLTEGFVDSVMAYYPTSNHYSQFDRDNVLRGINDALLGFAQAELAATSSNLLNLGQIATARNELAIANLKYDRMDYQGAVQDSLVAATNAQEAHALSGLGFGGLGAAGYTIVGLAAGVLVGLVIGYLLFERRRRTYAYAAPGAASSPGSSLQYGRCPTCGQSLRWDPMMMQWYCDNCKHFVKQ